MGYSSIDEDIRVITIATELDRANSDRLVLRLLQKNHKGRRCCWKDNTQCDEGYCINCAFLYDSYWEGIDAHHHGSKDNQWRGFCHQSGQLRRIFGQLGLDTDWCDEDIV